MNPALATKRSPMALFSNRILWRTQQQHFNSFKLRPPSIKCLKKRGSLMNKN